ncbi:hypothetical protein N8D56_10235 [Devosia sp. A8/3-2]|nr:hypothetical protein N8D56_10235 [Devosia sp. A8/3-2]
MTTPYDLAENLPEKWAGQDVVGCRETDFPALPLARQLITAFDVCLTSGQPQRFGFELADPIRPCISEPNCCQTPMASPPS